MSDLTRRHRRGRRYQLEPDARRYCSINESESSTNAPTTTYNIDKRVAGGTGTQTIVSADSSTVTVTDGGAVQAAFGFATNALNKTLDSINSAAQQTFDTVQGSEARVADAYETAKAGEQKILVGIGLAIVGVVAVAALRGRG